MNRILELLKTSGCVKVDEDHEWGFQLRFVNEKEYCGKLLILENTTPGSLHSHSEKKETFIVLQGRVAMFRGGKGVLVMNPGDTCTFLPREKHQMWALNIISVIMEVSTYDSDEDITRYELNGE